MSFELLDYCPKIQTLYSKKQIDKAGKIILNKYTLQDDIYQSYNIINSWRASHTFYLNDVGYTLQSNNHNTMVVQRIKRLDSIIGKLKRFPNMNLSKMQDIGGCRVILSNVEQVYEAISDFKSKNTSIIFKKENDYIQNPKST